MSNQLEIHQNVDGSNFHVHEELKTTNPNESNKDALQSKHHKNLSDSPKRDQIDNLEPELQKKIKKENLTCDNNVPSIHENPRLNEVLRSRKIHKQLLIRKSRWKPSETELKVLKKSFESNQYPTKQSKEQLLELLEKTHGSKIELNQIGRWFQHQRERCVKIGESHVKKNTYKKFDQEELQYLQDCFNKNTYPKLEEMSEIAKKLNSNLSKIENWYKHNRRSLAKKGKFELKNKKYFKKEELDYLLECFSLFPRPTKQKYADMAKTLDCNEAHIKNWYSNKRKKTKKNKLLQNLGRNDDTVLNNGEILIHRDFNASSNPLILNGQVLQGAIKHSTQNEMSEQVNDLNGSMNGSNSSPPLGGVPLINRSIPVTATTNGVFQTCNQGAIPIIYNGSMPMTTTNGSMPIMMTNGSIPIISNGAIPLTSNGAIRYGPPNTTSSPINTNYVISASDGQTYSMMSNQPTSNGNLQFVNGTRYYTPDQGQTFQPNQRQITRPMEVSSNMPMNHQFGYGQQQTMNGQMIYPQMVMVPSNSMFVPYGQNIQDQSMRSGPIYINSTVPNTIENKQNPQNDHHHDSTPKSRLNHNGMSNPSSSNNSSSSDENAQSSNVFVQSKNDAFFGKTTNPKQDTQGNSTDATNSTNNASSVSSGHSVNGHQQIHNCVQQINGVNNGWTNPVNGAIQGQGGVMYIPVSQAPTTALMNGQSQFSYCVNVLYPWQTAPNATYGPTHQNNSYIYNNSTTYSNYNNGFVAQPNMGFNSNIIITDYSVNGMEKNPQIQMTFDNSTMQKVPSQNLSSSNRQ